MTIDNTFEKIKSVILSKQSLNNPFDQTYVRRLELYPQFLGMEYWFTHGEYIDIKAYLEEENFSGDILDFGCGSGHMDVMLARLGYTVHGIDLSPMAIDICNILRNEEPLDVQNRVDFSLEDITIPNSKDRFFDLVWSAHTFEHILDPGPIFDGLRSRVHPGTKMRISVPLGYAFNDPDHVHHWADKNEFMTFFNKFVFIERVDIQGNIIIGHFIL